jgi:hypothetical protein
MTPPNPLNGIVAFLRADEAVADRVGTRIYGPDGLPRSSNSSAPTQSLIVVSGAGGLGAFGRGYQDYGDIRIDVACYGKTQAESYEVFLDVRNALKHANREVVGESADEQILIHWARIAADGTTGRDPLTGWPMTLSSWQVLVSEVGIPA